MRKPVPPLWRSRFLRAGLALAVCGTGALVLVTSVADARSGGEALRRFAALAFTTAQFGLALIAWAAIVHLVNAARLASKPRP